MPCHRCQSLMFPVDLLGEAGGLSHQHLGMALLRLRRHHGYCHHRKSRPLASWRLAAAEPTAPAARVRGSEPLTCTSLLGGPYRSGYIHGVRHGRR